MTAHRFPFRAVRPRADAVLRRIVLLASLGLPSGATPAAGANATTPGILEVAATLLSAGFEWRIAGDDDRDCAVALEYRRAADATWKPAQPLHRVERGLWVRGEDPGNLLAGSLFFLEPGTDYVARLTLADPDGGAEQRVVAFTTRTEPAIGTGRTLHVAPGSGGGSGTATDPFRGLAAADAAALPGDLFLLASGVYHGEFAPTRDGTPGQPIVYRGVDQPAVILTGDGSMADSVHCIRLVGRRHVFVENLSVVESLRPINADSTLGVVVRGCLIRPVDALLGTQAIRAAVSRDLFIADNRIEMPGRWEEIGRTGTYGTGGYGILVEGPGHVICHNTVIEAWDGISIPVSDGAVPVIVTRNVDIYGNFVDRGSDDGIQADAVHHNVRIFRNRLLNTGSAVSFQPGFGGPGYVLMNELFNNRIEPYKLHQETSFGPPAQETSGFVVYHNTSFCSRNGWRETGIWRHGRFRNNVFLGARDGPTLDAGSVYVGADLDYNAYNRVAGSTNLVYYGGNHVHLPAFYAARGHEQHGVELTLSAFVNAAPPHHPNWNPGDGYGAAYDTDDYDLRPVPLGAAVDRGVPLPNVNDGWVGAAPDLGCHEVGALAPAYGTRLPIRPLADVAAVASRRPALAPFVPNPSRGRAAIRFVLPEPGPASLEVFDLRGARVRTLIAGELAAGAHGATWDGRSADGRPVPAGVYLCRLAAGGRVATGRLVLVR